VPAETVGDEIAHLQRDKGYPPKRAQAAALNMQRHGRLRAGRRKKARKASR